MKPEEIKMLKQLIEIKDNMLGIENKNYYGVAFDRGVRVVVEQLLKRYKTTEEWINDHQAK